ncbi:hypothetical protein [Microvirga arsenatis]|uniref:HARP domain-containing protein n=1 Tax=Microvirga arsenatis TaxID=2692265 RepID=A0ABW9Z3V7_9HYPH|nr:hypothetical protein [Microvirga arsenatis]NBJ12583.1 hypothetical protein [Microvirga arsenatis]NBJ27384.1 hypothetical protein [Microvirga arsenatis]
MEIAAAFQVTSSDDEDRPGAYAAFPYDRELVRRFRSAFPRARWREEGQRWFVPGTTAVQRLDAWMAQELDTLDRHADAKGRDAYAFDPLESPYLTPGKDLRVRTPYSRTVVEALRAIPWARWDPEERVWHVPFRSYEALKARWPEIEEAARRNEPDARRRRREEGRGHVSEEAARWQAERRRRRYPVPGDDLPPLGFPLATAAWGVVVVEDIGSEPIREPEAAELYPHMRSDPARFVWARWRMPSLQEVYRTRPSREEVEPELRSARGWWWASRDELRERARRLREMERAQRARDRAKASLEA